jgi:2-polyprenyl-6-methoxyphenol hydroxylase-like FAD-dependent oxidoreductase
MRRLDCCAGRCHESRHHRGRYRRAYHGADAARGIDCEISQSETIRELGVGINTLPHAIKELAELGLLDALDAAAIRTFELIYTNRFGQEVWREPRGTDAGYEYPQFSIHRGRLQGVIHNAVRARIGESRIHTHDWGLHPGRRRHHRIFSTVTARTATARGDILVGADGIHSTVREALPERRPGALERSCCGGTDWPQTGRSMVIAGGMAAKL